MIRWRVRTYLVVVFFHIRALKHGVRGFISRCFGKQRVTKSSKALPRGLSYDYVGRVHKAGL